MNKETFSRYGSIIAMVLVLAVMITFAAPFGNAITSGVNNFVNGFGNAMNGNIGGGGSGSSGIKLDAPTNLALSNNQLSFNLVPNANQYILYVNDEVSATYATSPIDVSTYIETYGTPITFKLVASDSTGAYGNSAATEYIAAGDGKMVLKAGTYRFNDELNYSSFHNYSFDELWAQNHLSDCSIDFVYDGENYNVLQMIGFRGENEGAYAQTYTIVATDFDFESESFVKEVGIYSVLYENGELSDSAPGYQVSTPVEITLESNQEVNETFGRAFVSNTNYNEVNGITESACGPRKLSITREMSPMGTRSAVGDYKEIYNEYYCEIDPVSVLGYTCVGISAMWFDPLTVGGGENYFIIKVDDNGATGYLACGIPFAIENGLTEIIANVTYCNNETMKEWLLANTDPVETLEYDAPYALKATYTNEELAGLFSCGDNGTATESLLYTDDVTTLGIEGENGAYVLVVVKGQAYFLYFTEESVEAMGSAYNINEPGWYVVAHSDSETNFLPYTSTIPITFNEDGNLATTELNDLKPLIDFAYDVDSEMTYGTLSFNPSVSTADILSVTLQSSELDDSGQALLALNTDGSLIIGMSDAASGFGALLVKDKSGSEWLYVNEDLLAFAITNGMSGITQTGWYNQADGTPLNGEMTFDFSETTTLYVPNLADLLPLFETHECSYTRKVPLSQYLKEEKVCPDKSIYYYSCACGKVGNETFEGGYVIHDFVDTTCAGCGARQPGLYQDGALVYTWAKLVELNYMDSKCAVVMENNSQLVGDLVFPNDGSLTSLPQFALIGCGNLTSVTLPDGLTSIGMGAFWSCSFESITLPEGLIYINDGAFYFCEELVTISIPNSVVYIAPDAFENCDSLRGTVTYDNATYLGNETNPYLVLAKAVNTDITSCQIHKDTKWIASKAFDDCKKLSDITLPEGLIGVGCDAFYNCDAITTITIPETMTVIGRDAFYGCEGLTTVYLPNTLERIEEYAFEYSEPTLIYDGTIADWNKITLEQYWEPCNIDQWTVVCTDGELHGSPSIQYISLSSGPNKRTYAVGEEFDPAGVRIQVITGRNGTTQFYDHTHLTFSGFDSSEPATDQVVTVTYKGYSTSFKVQIVAAE